MLIFNGKKYAKNDAEFMESLFHRDSTCNGYYKRLKRGIQIFNMQRLLIAFVVSNDKQGHFTVSASIHDGKPVYMYGLNDETKKYLGLDALTYSEQRDAAKAVSHHGT